MGEETLLDLPAEGVLETLARQAPVAAFSQKQLTPPGYEVFIAEVLAEVREELPGATDGALMPGVDNFERHHELATALAEAKLLGSIVVAQVGAYHREYGGFSWVHVWRFVEVAATGVPTEPRVLSVLQSQRFVASYSTRRETLRVIFFPLLSEFVGWPRLVGGPRCR